MALIVRRALKQVVGLVRPRGEQHAKSPYEDFSGDWAAAQAACEGYAAPVIVKRVLEASLAVEEGRAVHERDSVNFTEITYAWPVLAGLMWTAARSGGGLRVIDLGGSLGSSYRQNRKFLSTVPEASWAIVEQPIFVAAGRAHFEDERLSFHETILSAGRTHPTVGLVSGALQFLEDPVRVLTELTEIGISTLILDRTPVHSEEEDLITLQHVPESIYPATYPARILSRSRLFDALHGLGWSVLEEFETLERSMATRSGFRFDWTGLICTRAGDSARVE